MIEPDLTLHFSDKVAIPEACQNCPTLAELRRIHDSLAQRAGHLADFVVSGQADSGLDQFMERQGLTDEEARDATSGYKTGLRRVTSDMVNGMYDDADKAAYMAEDTIRECPPEGTFSLRARRSGKQIVARFCMSARMEQMAARTGSNNESVAVYRTDIPE